MTMEQNVCAAEAIIFASGDGISTQKLKEVLDLDLKQLQFVLESLSEKYNTTESGVRFVKNIEQVFFTTDTAYADVVYKALSQKRNAPLSNAAMETLAIIAYNQPVSRSFIEQVRGVDCSGVISTLVEKNLIEECGRLELPGRPLLYGTTKNFLRCFSVSSLSELPKLPGKENETAVDLGEQLMVSEVAEMEPLEVEE